MTLVLEVNPQELVFGKNLEYSEIATFQWVSMSKNMISEGIHCQAK